MISKENRNIGEKRVQLDQSPLFRNVIIPWYDSNPSCWILVVWAFCVMIFGVVGVVTALTRQEYADYLWFPCMLTALSLFLGVKVMMRLANRRRNS